MKIKLSLIFFIVTLATLVAQNDDVYENWSSIEVDYGLTKNIDIYGGGQLRIKSVGDTYNKSFYEIGAKIKINDYLSSGFGYRGIDELDEFLNQKNPKQKVKVKKDKAEVDDKSLKFVDIINTENVLNPNILIGLAAFIILVLLSFALNNSSTISETDKENELRITKSDIESLYVVRTQEILSEETFSFPITIRFKSNNENYIEYSDNGSGKEYFIFEDNNVSQSKSFSEIWNGDNKTFLIANTVDFELIFFSENTFSDFSDNIINDFPVRVDLIADPLSVSITKYIPKNK